MPSRVIRDGWLESERINTLDAPAERFFLRLCLRADDYGRYHGNPVLLKSNLFPLRDDVRSTDIPRWLAACETAGLLRCYEHDGKRYVEILRFDQRMRAKVSKFPQPPAGISPVPGICQTDDSHARSETESEAESDDKIEASPLSPPPASDPPGDEPFKPLVADPGPPAPNPPIPYAEVMEMYNTTCPTMPRARLTDQRRKAIRARWFECQRVGDVPLTWFANLFGKAAASDFLAGRKTGSGNSTWRCTFDWLIGPKNAPKVVEGNYDNRTAGHGGNSQWSIA